MNTIFDCSRVKGDKEPKLDLSARLHLTRGCADFSMEKICYADKASSSSNEEVCTKFLRQRVDRIMTVISRQR